MWKIGALIIVLALTLGACKANRWYGSFAGKTTENSNVRRASGAMPEANHGDTAAPGDPEVTLERESRVAFLTFRKCRLRLDLTDATHAIVSDGQTCILAVDGQNTKMTMKGSATFDTADTFTAEITGAPTENGVSGEYVWKFAGTRKP